MLSKYDKNARFQSKKTGRLTQCIVLAIIHQMNWYFFIISLFTIIPFTYAETINIGGGGAETCKGNFDSTHPIEWHYHLFPVPVMIDSRL